MLQSTEDKYALVTGETEFLGAFAEARRLIDYSWYKNYTSERQALQDGIVERLIQVVTGTEGVEVKKAAPMPGEDEELEKRTKEKSDCGGSGGSGGAETRTSNKNNVADRHRRRPWAIYMCGVFGAGKSHVIRWMRQKGMLDFLVDGCCFIDPDAIKHMLPEYAVLLRQCPEQAAGLVHKESSFIARLAEHVALQRRLHLLVDGSLQHTDWYKEWFARLGRPPHQYKIMIVKVNASLETAWRRCQVRAKQTGRHIALDTLQNMAARIEPSFAILKKVVDVSLVFDNEHETTGAVGEPKLIGLSFQ